MELRIEDIVNVFYLVYAAVRSFIQSILETTIFRAEPSLSAKFADALTLLITVTAVWLILEFATGFRKIVRILVLVAWLLFALSVIVSMRAP